MKQGEGNKVRKGTTNEHVIKGKSSRHKRGSARLEKLLALFISIVIGSIIGVWMVSYLAGEYGAMNGRVILIIYSSLGMCLLSLYLNIIFHEGGHLIFGLLTGYSFLSFRIYSLTITREEGKLRCKRYSVPGTSGQCLMVPPAVQSDQLPFLLYNFGGVIMNFLISILAILPMILFPQLSLQGKFLLGGFAAGGILLGLMNGLPTKLYGIANDGYHVKSILRNPIARNSFRLQLELIKRETLGERLRDMPEEWFQLPEGAEPSNVINAYLLYMNFNRNLDRMDFASAKDSLNLLNAVLLKLPSSYRNITELGYLFLSILEGAATEEIEQYLTKQCKRLIKAARNEMNIRRIAYAYYRLYTRSEKEAEDCRRSLLKLAKHYPIRAEAQRNLMLMGYIDELAGIRATIS